MGPKRTAKRLKTAPSADAAAPDDPAGSQPAGTDPAGHAAPAQPTTTARARKGRAKAAPAASSGETAADGSDPQPAASTPAVHGGGDSSSASGTADGHWGRLPTEVKHRIIRMSSPLTRFGLGWLAAPDINDFDGQRDMWLEIFETDWQGDLASLPRPRAFFVNKETARMIRTREMFARAARLDWFDLWSLQHAVVRNRWEDLLDMSNHTKMASIAAAENAVWLLEQLLVKKRKDSDLSEWLDEAIKNGATDTTRLLLDTIEPTEHHARLVECALMSGSLDIVKLLFERKPEWFAGVNASCATYKGHLDIVKFVHEKDACVFDERSMTEAIRNGHVDVVDFLWQHRRVGFPPHILNEVCRSGHIAVLTYLIEHCHVELCALDLSLLMGSSKPAAVLPIFDAMVRPDMQIGLHQAVYSGNAVFAKRVFAHGNFSVFPNITWTPIKTNNLQMLKLLHENGITEVSARTLEDAAAAGSLRTIKYAVEQMGAELPPKLIEKAAAGGHLELVKWLHEQRGQSATAFVMDHAAASGNVDLVKWLHARPKSKASKAAMNKAAANGHLAVVEFLHTHRAEGCTVKAMDKAGERGHAHVLDFLHKNRTEGFTDAMFRVAVDRDQRAVVRWVLENVERRKLDLNRAIRSALSSQLVDMCNIIEEYAQAKRIKLAVKRRRD
ncbi:hypothetical protein HK105_204653 [Polyrhizophydium stewartii]|uniref:Ankyrin repeat protein n=1 Tax=Polyrhizophydium stewartii TaxID=2732419 RepID=A0ABR4N859_9FUNG